MTDDDPENRHPWFVFTIQKTEGIGVDIPKLARLLNDLSSAFYAIARARIGAAGPRPGRRATAEETLAALRVIRVTPGSTAIELAPPPQEAQGKLELFEEATPDDIAMELYREIADIDKGEPPSQGRWDIRKTVRSVIEDAGEIGERAEIRYRPLSHMPRLPKSGVFRRSFRVKDLPETPEPKLFTRKRKVSGHAYMVDVEPGKQRLRIKLPDGRDITLDVGEEVAAKLAPSLDRVVDIQIEEQMEGDVTTRRVARDVDVLPSSEPGSDRPPKSIEELEREQRMPARRPDYVSLASAIWQTEDELVEFERHLREIRQAAG